MEREVQLEPRTQLFLWKQDWQEAIDGLKLIYSLSSTSLTLHLINVPVTQRNRGYGNMIMKEMTSFCDYNNLTLNLTPVDYYGVPIPVLQRFYANHGLQEEPSGDMVRKPAYSQEFIGISS